MCQEHVSMGFTKQTFPAGTHMCLIYNDDAELFETGSFPKRSSDRDPE